MRMVRCSEEVEELAKKVNEKEGVIVTQSLEVFV